METVVPDIALTGDTSPFVSDGRLNNNLSPWKSWFLHHHPPLDSSFLFPSGILVPEPPTVFSGSGDQPGFDHPNSGNEHGVPIDFASTLTRPESADLYEPSRSHLPLVGVWSDASLPLLAGGGSDGVTETDNPYRTLALDMAPKPSAMQQTPVLIPTFSGSVGYDANTITGLSPIPSPKNSTLVSWSCGSAGDSTTSINNEMETPIVLYRPAEKKGSSRRRCHRACVINIGGLWIDKDELYSGASKGDGTISVHECQWAKSTNPCGMWIVGSRFSVGAHIRKWHAPSHADSMAQCLWHGCATGKSMLRDSINRHVVTVHLGEGFYCRGCNQEFSRKDVYDRHVRKGELCREAGVAIVYGTERRVIDTRQVLRRGGTIRFAD